MATALAATAQAATPTVPASVLLNVTGAPSPPAGAYTSNFTSGPDSWTASGTGVVTTLWTTPDKFIWLKTLSPQVVGNVVTASRVLTGLTIGAGYRFRALVTRNSSNGGNTSLRITGDVAGAYVGVPLGVTTTLELLFTATATTHTINVDQASTTATAGIQSVYVSNPGSASGAVTVAPTGTWLGTTITRTDANGTAVPVRNPTNLDTAGGTLTLTDYEHALVGPCTYTVTDGAGATATANVTAAPGQAPSLTLPASAVPPRTVTLVAATTYDEASESQGTVHTVLGRVDKLSNPGTLLARTGTLELFCTDYASADSIRELLKTATTALFRQADYPGMDLYFVARSVTITPAEPTVTRHWLVAVAYDEVPRP